MNQIKNINSKSLTLEKAYVCFSFDDGRIDTYHVAYPILKKHQLCATFNITSGYVESGTFVDSNVCDIMPMNIEMLKEMSADDSVEIAGHGHKHKNTIEDIIKGIRCLKEWIPKQREWGFASPGTGLTLDYYHSIKEELGSNSLLYVRFSCRYHSFAMIKVFIRRLSRLIHIPILYRFAYKDTLMSDVDDDILYSVPVLSDISVAEIQSLIDLAIKRKQVCILMFHSIVDRGEIHDSWDYDKVKFEDICNYVSDCQRKGLLEVSTSMDIYKRLKAVNNV